MSVLSETLHLATLGPLLFSLLLVFLTYVLLRKLTQFHSYTQLINKIPGPEFSSSPLGHLYMFRPNNDKVDQVANFFNSISGLAKTYEPTHSLIRLWLSIRPIVVIFKADAAEKILTSSVHIQKAIEYKLVVSWLGTGLLTSWGKKWFQRRKMITPAFHFNILEAFLPGINEQAQILVKKLRTQIQLKGEATEGTVVDVVPYLTYCALDVICETAMGTSVESQSNNDNEYVNAIHRVGNNVMKRYLKPWLWNDTFYFNFTSDGRQDARDLKILHNFSIKVIEDRVKETKENPQKFLSSKSNSNGDGEENQLKKRRLAFLDMLIEQHLKDPNSLTLAGIREEVDTFMFEGHDTVTVSMIWTLFLLGHHPEIQERVQQEIDHVWVNEDEPLTSNQLREMKLLEACIKESLRLFPSVPYIGRVTAEDIQFDGFVIPKDTTLLIFIAFMQRDPKIFEKPNSFVPERFLENSDLKRNPFAYVPFSAGPRNCIGQKFALQEEKVILATVLKNFCLQSQKTIDHIFSSPELVFRPKEAIDIRIVCR